MSSDGLEQREELLAEFVREVRQFNGLGAAFFRAAAARAGMNVTDLQVTDILDITGPTTAGRLAELTGLTTGAITTMLDRLEKAGLVSRERDPQDGRRVIVRLTPSEEAISTIGPVFESIGQGWDQIASGYSDEQLTFLLEFLKRCNAMSRDEFSRLRESPQDGEKDFSAPLANAASQSFQFFSQGARLSLRAEAGMADLYRAHFKGTVPQVKAEAGSVIIRYPQRLWLLAGRQRSAEVALSVAVPWRITVQSGVSDIHADLTGINLAELEVKSGMSMVQLTLPEPSGSIPVRLAGGSSVVKVQHPKGVPVRAHLKGWSSILTLDEQKHGGVGKEAWLQSPGYDAATRRYDMEITGDTSVINITSE